MNLYNWHNEKLLLKQAFTSYKINETRIHNMPVLQSSFYFGSTPYLHQTVCNRTTSIIGYHCFQHNGPVFYTSQIRKISYTSQIRKISFEIPYIVPAPRMCHSKLQANPYLWNKITNLIKI